MLEDPGIPAVLILSALRGEFGLGAAAVTFLPLGYDVNTAVYEVKSSDGARYFLKIRSGAFDEISVNLPAYLNAHGNPAIIAPLPALDQRLWGSMDAGKILLYPFVDGENGYRVALSESQWLDFGAALGKVHAAQLPAQLAGRIPVETFSPAWRESVRRIQMQVADTAFAEPSAAKLAAFMRRHRQEISRLVALGERLGGELQAHPPQFVLCHSDIHAGNILIAADAKLYIVDWDAPVFAPKERDLSQVGGSATWNSADQTALFYQGYGDAAVNRKALAYYRCERVIQDIAAFCEQLLLSDSGGEDREQSYEYFTASFLPGHEVELAFKTVEIA